MTLQTIASPATPTAARVDSAAEAGRQRRSWIAPASLSLALLMTFSANTGADSSHQAYFAEPASGRKVTHYEIELPVTRDRRESFTIPDNCTDVMRAISGGASHKGTIIGRRLWKKVEADCRYHGFLNRHPQQVDRDHVSGYDFRNLQIADLPLDRRCAQSTLESDPTGCNPTATDESGMLRHFPIASVAGEVSDRTECIPCRLSHGRFRGYVLIEDDGIRCRMDANAPGVRLIGVDFADINGDRILDAVLRFIAIGPGMNRQPLVLPLTKTDASAPFTVPAPAGSD